MRKSASATGESGMAWAGGRYATLVSRDAHIATSPPEAEVAALAPAS